MKLLRLLALIVFCWLAVVPAFGQNCPPGSIYPNPQIIPSFAPDSSCLDTSRNGTGSIPDDKHSCLGACENSFVTYCTQNVAGSTYLWSVVGGTIVGSATSPCISVLWGPSGPGTITVTVTNAAGCTATKEKCVQIIDSPIAAFSAPSSVCKNVPVNFLNQSTGGTTYFWDFGDGNTSTLQNPSHTYTIPGTHVVTLVVSNKCGCKDSVQHTITVSNLSGPVISCPATVCASAHTCYSTVSGCPTAVYHWIVTGGTIVGPANLNNICVQWGAGPVGTVSLYITGCDSVCADTTTATIPIISTNGPITGNLNVCPGAAEVYSLPLWPGTYYSWTLSGGGTIISGQNTNNLAIHWGTTPGTYTLSATWNNILLGCGGNATIMVNIKDQFQLFGLPGPFCIGSNSNFFANGNANWTVTGGTFTGNGTSSITVTWTTGGTQTVTAVPLIPSAYCNPSASMTVTVATVPPAVSISGPPVICPGGTYQYTATTSGPGFTLLWTVTGGTIVGSNAANPVSVQWSGPGTVSVQQVMTTPPYCPSPPISLPVTVFNVPSITGSNNACMDQTTVFTAGGPNPGIVYTWSIVDGSNNPSAAGSITSGQGTNQISVLWHGPGGTAVVKLKVCSATLTFTVTINPKPNASISMSGQVCNPGGQVILTASAGTQWSWSNGANTQAIIVTAPGPYWVAVKNSFGCWDTARITVPVSPGPTAYISTPNPTSFCTPAPPFTDTLYALQGPGYTYLWSPGGQNTPTITVSSLGSYSVVVTDANGCSSTSNVITISAGPCPPPSCTPDPGASISFTVTTPICNPVQFNGSSTGLTGLVWNFGDPNSGANNTSVLTNPSHLFTQAGWYTVTYTGTDVNGCVHTASQAVPVPLAADFSFAGVCGVITFTDHSTFLPPNAITSWSWTFSGGSPSSSTLQNPPAVTFSSPGVHNVTLQVSNGTCMVSITKPVTVAPPPSAAFTLPSQACAGTDVNLSGPGAPIVSWLWNFGDAQTSALQNTSHAWATAGTYVVTLTVKDSDNCTNSVMDTITITAPNNTCPINPTNPLPVCQGGSVLLTATAANAYQWILNGNPILGANNQTYNATVTGTYTVADTDAGGCVCISPPVNVVVNPLPPANITPSGSPILCGGGIITLSAPVGLYTYFWSDSSTTQSITLNLSIPGTYVYTVTVTDTATGCSNTSAPFTINVYPNPAPPIITASGPTALCKGDSVTLTSSYPVGNMWNTGATTQSITVHTPGLYVVTVTNNHGCQASASITVTSNTPDLSLYPFGCDKLCDTVKIPGPIGPFVGYYTYQWFFNGNPIAPPNGTNDTLTPIGSGTYTLILTGPGPTFCKDTSGPYNLTLHDCDSSLCHGKICGRKWNDANGNHKFNYGTEFGIPGWKICLVKCNVDNYPTKDTIMCTTTDSQGFYCFTNLCAGDYCVVEVPKPGWQQTWPISPKFYHVTITDSGTISGLDFGNKKKCIDIIITHDTVGVGHDGVLNTGTVIPQDYPWPIKISYQNSSTGTFDSVFEGLYSANVTVIPNLPCPPGTYRIIRKHIGNYQFDRIYVNDTLRSPDGDSIDVTIPDTGGGASILLLNVFVPDSTLRFRTFTAAQLAGADQGKPVKKAKPGRPVIMPTTANVIDEILKQGGSLLVGSPGQLNSAGKEKGYLQPKTQGDVFKTFYTKGFTHTGKPRGFDFIKGKPILKRQKSLPATKFNNKLMANLLALQINIAASESAPPKTPPGFGDLLYDNGPNDPMSGKTINEIADYGSDLMTNWEFNDSTVFIGLNATVEMINAAFSGPLPFGPTDTLVWLGGKFQLTGVKSLFDVPFLSEVMGAPPTTRKIKPLPGSQLPTQFVLNQNYPNPFNPTTTISFTIPAEATVSLKVYNILGQVVATLIDREVIDEGDQQVDFDAHRLSSGVYFYQLTAETTPDQENGVVGQRYFNTKKMLLVR